MVNCIIFTSITIRAVPAAIVRGVIPSSSDAIAYTEGNNSGLSQLLLYSVSNPIFCLLVAYLSVGFVLLLCLSIERLLYEAESHGLQEKSPSRYCRHILVLFCFDLPVILYFAYWWHIYLWDLCFICVQVLSICCMKLNHMVSRRNHLLDIVDTFWYYSALTFQSSVRGVIPSSSDAITCTERNSSQYGGKLRD